MVLVAAAALIFGGGCGGGKKPITELQRKEAAHLAAEAQFALTMRDYARAEAALAKAAAECPDTGTYWISLGGARMRLGNRAGAKSAYQAGLKAYEIEAGQNPTLAEPWLKQIYVMALLGRLDEGRKLIEVTAKRFPGDRGVRLFVEEKQFDQMLADLGFKQEAL